MTARRLLKEGSFFTKGSEMYEAMFKKNPLMSLWMSAANSAAGAARGQWMAEMHRQQNAMKQQFTKQAIDFWSGALGTRSLSRTQAPAAAPHRKAKRRV